MELLCKVVLFCVSVKLIDCVTGDPFQVNMGYQPIQGRTSNTFPVMAQFPTYRNFIPKETNQPLLHIANGPNTNSNAMPENRQTSGNELTFDDFLDTWDDHFLDDREQFRAAAGRDEQTYPYPNPPAYGYPPGHNYGPSKPTAYTHPANSATPKISLLKPDLTELVRPVTSKVISKVNGLLGFILALLSGTVPQGLQLQGMKDLLINGVLQPLLAAKIGIKSLIAKLIVPVIALILINVEVLVTVWWLWEECPQSPTPAQETQTKPPQYNSYR